MGRLGGVTTAKVSIRAANHAYPREQVHDAQRAESPALCIRDATPHRGVGPVTARFRRIQTDEQHARPIRPAVIPIVAVPPARAEDGMVRSGGEECGKWLHGKRSCRMLADGGGDFRDEIWGQIVHHFHKIELWVG